MTDPNSNTYPLTRNCRNAEDDGLTKREHFAALAMQGLLANSRIDWQLTRPDQLGKKAVIQADALITALNEEQS